MRRIAKLQEIATQMHLEPAEEVGSGLKSRAEEGTVAPCGVPLHKSNKREALGIFQASLGGGKTTPMLKTMLTTACERNCYYCPFRAGRNYKRVTFKPEEMASSFMQMHDAGMVDGIFLSSGIIRGGVTTQDKLIDTISILRQKHQFKGFVHLKIMPGVEKAQVEHAMKLSDRLSINMEAPTAKHLQFLAPMKELTDELFQPLKWVEEFRRTRSPREFWKGKFPSTVTQFVVGAAPETDLELLHASDYLYNKIKLRRTYFSAFRPIENTPLDHLPPENPRREHRLYQASFMLRDYAWQLEDMPFQQDGKLPLNIDPKLAWANENLLHKPVELNRASKHELLQVPGIGPKSAELIVKTRRHKRLSDLAQIKKLGIPPKRVQNFVLLDGRRPERQLAFAV